MRDVESEDVEARREDDCVLGIRGSQQIAVAVETNLLGFEWPLKGPSKNLSFWYNQELLVLEVVLQRCNYTSRFIARQRVCQ